MKILAIDTATEACSAALFIDSNLTSRFEVCPQQHSQKLLPMVDELLQEQGLRIGQLDLLAFGRGPGSFTGVRIATGMIQGFAYGGELQVASVSTLAMMAQQCVDQHNASKIAVAIDARMDEVYFAIYQNENGTAVLSGEEQVLAPAQAALLVAQSGCDQIAGTGWSAYQPLVDASSSIGQAQILYPSSEYMLPLIRLAKDQDQLMDADQVQPVYLRDKVTWKKLPGRE